MATYRIHAFIHRSLDFTHSALIDARNGTDELHFVPERGQPLDRVVWHTTRIEDLIISRVTGQPELWSEEWASRTGLPFDGIGAGMPDEVRSRSTSPTSTPSAAVFERTAQFLADASDADLEREIPARNGTESVGEAISLHMMGHFNGHRGEINTLRGMQGMRHGRPGHALADC